MRKLARILAMVAAGLAVGAANASAQGQGQAPARVETAPQIAGSAQVGSELTAAGATWRGVEPIEVRWQWLRCEQPEFFSEPEDGRNPPDFEQCVAITGASSEGYVATPDDIGSYLRVLLTVRNQRGRDWAISPASERVADVPPPAAPAPAAPAPGALPQVPATEPPSGTGDVLGVSAPRLLRPFPLVRIRGYLTRRGARITLLRVEAPRGSRIVVRCRGTKCPRRRWARIGASTRVKPFERRLVAGTRLVITVTKPDRIGKHTIIRIRRGRPPSRSDRCLAPGSAEPMTCAGA